MSGVTRRETGESAKKIPRKHGNRFPKGKSGNPGGRPADAEGVRKLARSYSAEAIATLVTLMRDPDKRTRHRAAVALLDRAWGRPETSPLVALTVNNPSTPTGDLSGLNPMEAYQAMLQGRIAPVEARQIFRSVITGNATAVIEHQAGTSQGSTPSRVAALEAPREGQVSEESEP